ncbi:hypothetical protein EJD97_013255, partial [Solanum chilense]
AINIVLTASDVAADQFCTSRCPGQCAWPFHQPNYGPQGPALVAPNNDMGSDGMVINLTSLLAETVTDPFGNRYYQRSADTDGPHVFVQFMN